MSNELIETRHGWMLINPLDMYVGRSLKLYGEFSRGEYELFASLLQPEHVVIEVGANIGAHTIAMAKKAAVVIAFEPQRLIYQMLCANVALNGLRNVRTLNAGVGEEPGWCVLPDLDPDQEQNFGGLSLAGHEHGEQVGIIPLDSMAARRVDFIKIDVEGMELEVLKGAYGMIQHFRPILYVEDDREENRDALRAYISDELGYRYEVHQPLLFDPENHAGNQDNVFGLVRSTNLVCYPSQQ